MICGCLSEKSNTLRRKTYRDEVALEIKFGRREVLIGIFRGIIMGFCLILYIYNMNSTVYGIGDILLYNKYNQKHLGKY